MAYDSILHTDSRTANERSKTYSAEFVEIVDNSKASTEHILTVRQITEVKNFTNNKIIEQPKFNITIAWMSDHDKKYIHNGIPKVGDLILMLGCRHEYSEIDKKGYHKKPIKQNCFKNNANLEEK